MMNIHKDGHRAKHCYTESKSGTSDTSVYSTCSNGHNSSSSSSNPNELIKSVRSVILAGQDEPFNAKSADATLGESFFQNEASYSISPLELNVDVLSEDNDAFTDCLDASKSDSNKSGHKPNSCNSSSKSNSNKNDSTEYVPYEAMENYKTNSQKCNNQADQYKHEVKKDKDPNRLITIVEESEMTRTTNSLIVKNIPSNNFSSTGKYLVDLASEIDNRNKVSTKRVLFANENDLPGVDERSISKSKNIRKTPRPLVGRSQFPAWKRKGTDENCNNHNTTESFVMWEKYCEASEHLDSRKSCSFSELNTTESYDGDNEFSATFRTLDDTYLSRCSVNSTNDENYIPKRKSIYRSKSCENLLKEVKHLPHVLYDKFLKCLAAEIENMRKQKVYCTCQRTVRKLPSKENIGKNTKNIRNPIIQVTNVANKKGNKLSPRTALLNPLTNRARLSPSLPKDSYQSHMRSKLSPENTRDASSKFRLSPDNNFQRLSPKSPNKTPTTPTTKQKLYWQKEIISPVGEYIRGKRPSPYRSSPNKRIV